MNVRGVELSSAGRTPLSTARRNPLGSAPRRADLADPRQVLDFEQAVAGLALSRGLKARFVREDFGVSLGAYHQVLVDVIRRPEAIAYAPQLVARLRRLFADRRVARTATRLGDVASVARPARPQREHLSFPGRRSA